jgi:hypothetical protein
MSGWFWTMMVATVTGTVTTLGVLWVCRWKGIAPLAKVWLCRFALLKWPLGLFVGVGVAVGSGVGAAPAWALAAMSGVFGLWVLGVALSVLDSVASWIRCRRTVLAQPVADTDSVVRCAPRIGLRGRIDVRKSPHALVMLAPHRVMAIPDGASDFVVLHELAHFRHRDLWWAGIASAVQCAFWFHPLVESLHREMRLWQDVDADQLALALSGVGARAAVGEIMSSATSFEAAAALALSADARVFARRFRHLYGERRSTWAVVAGVGLSLVLLVPLVPATAGGGPIRRSPTGEAFKPARSLAQPIATMHGP